jgi:hypothetical protein
MIKGIDRGLNGSHLFSIENMLLVLKNLGINLKFVGDEALKESGDRLFPPDIARIEAELDRLMIQKSGNVLQYLLIIAEHGGTPKSTSEHVLSDADIAAAYRRTRLSLGMYHEHPDCVRIAYEWLDAQVTVKKPRTDMWRPQTKHHVENWGKCYVSTSDVEVAAELHPRICGDYPAFNLSKRLTHPKGPRLWNIDEAGRHMGYTSNYDYPIFEPWTDEEMAIQDGAE